MKPDEIQIRALLDADLNSQKIPYYNSPNKGVSNASASANIG